MPCSKTVRVLGGSRTNCRFNGSPHEYPRIVFPLVTEAQSHPDDGNDHCEQGQGEEYDQAGFASGTYLYIPKNLDRDGHNWTDLASKLPGSIGILTILTERIGDDIASRLQTESTVNEVPIGLGRARG